jgi:hypothetical protein
MTQSREEDLVRRLGQLERKVSSLRLVAVVSLLFAAFSVWMALRLIWGPPLWKPDILESRYLWLQSDEKSAELQLLDSDHNLRMSLHIFEESPMFLLYDMQGQVRAQIGLKADGNPYLVFCDELKRRRVVLELDKAGPTFLLLNDQGEVLFSVPERKKDINPF